MHRTFCKKTAEDKLRDAQLLLKYRRYHSAYYLAGYSIEFALKSCIAKMFKRFEIPDPKEIDFKKIYTHDFDLLLKQANLFGLLKRELKINSSFRVNWITASEWSPKVRYEKKTKSEAITLIDALTDNTDGVMRWLKKHW